MNISHISRIRFTALLAASLSAMLAGCVVPPANKSANQNYRPFYADSEKRVANAGSGNWMPEIITPSSGRSIAVTDIAYRQEFRDFFYDEKSSIKNETLEIPRPVAPAPPASLAPPAPPVLPPGVSPDAPGSQSGLPRHIPDPAPMRNSSSLDRRAYLQSVFFRSAQANENETPSMDPPADAPPVAPPGPSVPGKATRNERTYSKKYGIERKVSYGELRGISGDIRALLIKSGYRVVAGKPAVEKPLQDDQYFDILARIKAGDFSGADYVLFGVLAEVAINEHNESIVGTRNSMQFHVLDLAIDFSLIDTQNGQIIASFTAVGSGREQRIDGKTSGYKPSLVRLVKQASIAIADDVALQLNSQNLTLSAAVAPQTAGSPSGSAGSTGGAKHHLDEDARSLRVYRQ